MRKMMKCPRFQKKALECLVVTGIMSVVAIGCGLGVNEVLYQVLYF